MSTGLQEHCRSHPKELAPLLCTVIGQDSLCSIETSHDPLGRWCCWELLSPHLGQVCDQVWEAHFAFGFLGQSLFSVSVICHVSLNWSHMLCWLLVCWSVCFICKRDHGRSKRKASISSILIILFCCILPVVAAIRVRPESLLRWPGLTSCAT